MGDLRQPSDREAIGQNRNSAVEIAINLAFERRAFVLSMRQRRWVRRPLMCWRPPTAAARWRRSSIHRRARSNAPEMNFLCARAAVQRVAAADALCERHPTMTMECMYFAPHTWPARPHAHTHFAEASSESECALLRLMGPSGPSYPLRCRLWRRKPAGDLRRGKGRG